MRAKLVRIGHFRGVRLPEALLQASGIVDEVELVVGTGCIVLTKPNAMPRELWAEAIAALQPDPEHHADWLDAPLADDADWDWPEDFAWPEDPAVLTFTLPPSTLSEDRKSPRPDPASSSRRTR